MATISLYKISDDSRVINKTLGTPLNGNTPIQLYLREDTNILSPEVSFPYSATYAGANYAYIPEWKRYYFISDMYVTPAARLYLRLYIDVLKTYASGILNCNCNVMRSESAGVNYVHDSELPINPDKCGYINTFLPSPFTNTGGKNICVGIFNSRS